MTIALPTDTKPSRIHKPTTRVEPVVEDLTQTLAEFERLAILSGSTVQIDPPEFSSDAGPGSWHPTWPVDAEHPEYARATVYRDGVPTRVYVSWGESLPEDEAWRALRERKPMQVFGAYAIRTALRRAFRDVIPDRVEPSDPQESVANARGTTLREEVAEVVAAVAPAPETADFPRSGPPMHHRQPSTTPRVTVKPTDIAAAIAKLQSTPPPQTKGGRRPQRQKPRADRG